MYVNLSSGTKTTIDPQQEHAQPTRRHAEAAKPQIQSGTSAPLRNAAINFEANVTFRRDSNGQIYYVVTDAQSGKELREVPSQEIRKVGEGIAEYLKREQEKSASHIELKA